MILEGKGLPTHLQKLENVDIPITVQSLINDLEDLGEVRFSSRYTLNMNYIKYHKINLNIIIFYNFYTWPKTSNLFISKHTHQVKVELSHHDRDADGAWKCAKPLVFVLDEIDDSQPDPKELSKKEKKKKKKKTVITAKNFGAFASISSLKGSDNLFLAWRVRLLWLKVKFLTGFDWGRRVRSIFCLCSFDVINLYNIYLYYIAVTEVGLRKFQGRQDHYANSASDVFEASVGSQQ